MHFYLEKDFFCIVHVYSFFLILVKILTIWLNYIMSLVSSSQNEFTYIDLHSRCHIISEIVSINHFFIYQLLHQIQQFFICSWQNAVCDYGLSEITNNFDFIAIFSSCKPKITKWVF